MLSRLRRALGPDRRGGGYPRLHLTLVLVFVVVTVIELTRTVVSARDIADTAVAIDTGLQPVERNTEQIQLLDRTTALTGDLMEQTAPVQVQAAQLDRTVAGIRGGARSVEQSSVAIQDDVLGIAARSGGIAATVEQLAGSVSSIERSATSIRASAEGINQHFATLLPVTRMIARGPAPFGVNTINTNTSTVIALLNQLEPDLDDVLFSVNEVDEHAASICRSDLVQGQNCDRP